MSVDRILQLKLIADVSDINGKMGQAAKETESGVGRMKGAIKGLGSFAGPIVADMALQVGSAIVGQFQAQLEHAKELRNAFEGLNAAAAKVRLKDVGVDPASIEGLTKAEQKTARIAAKQAGLRKVADDLRDIGVSLGVGEDAKIVQALRDITVMTGDLDLASDAVEAIFDVMRLLDVDFDEAKMRVVNGLILGRSRSMDILGVSAKTPAKRLKEFNTNFGQAAEDFAQTSEGKWQVATAEWDGHMLNLAILVDQAMLDLKGALVVAWNNLTGIVDGLALIWDGLAGKWGPALAQARDIIRPVLAPIGGILDTVFVTPFRVVGNTLGLLWKAITGDFKAFGTELKRYLKGFINTIIDLLNSMSEAFAFSFTFDIPRVDIPNPAHGTIFDPIGKPHLTIGGQSLDFSRGPLFDTIPHLAEGGIVRRPTLALVGEAGPEAVVPLGGRGMGNSYHITVNASASSPADTGRAIVEAIEAYERRAGASWRG